MENIHSAFTNIKRSYDLGIIDYNKIYDLITYCIDTLEYNCTKTPLASNEGKNYFVYNQFSALSRPINSSIYINDVNTFRILWESFNDNLRRKQFTLTPPQINSVIYTAVMAFSCCYDIWKNSSRKTPGTYFEVILGSFLSEYLSDFTRKKFISLPDGLDKVSTDISFDNGYKGLVFAAKITTRERIVQPYAHQRILDSIFGLGRFRSILMCVSETQRDDIRLRVNDICVPGTIRLFQAHLSALSGIYYLDPPFRYLQPDITNLVLVGDYGQFFYFDLPRLVQ